MKQREAVTQAVDSPVNVLLPVVNSVVAEKSPPTPPRVKQTELKPTVVKSPASNTPKLKPAKVKSTMVREEAVAAAPPVKAPALRSTPQPQLTPEVAQRRAEVLGEVTLASTAPAPVLMPHRSAVRSCRRWRRRWSSVLWDGVVTNTAGYSSVLSRGSLLISGSVAAMLLLQMLPKEPPRKQSTEPKVVVVPARQPDTTGVATAIELPSPPVVKVRPTPAPVPEPVLDSVPEPTPKPAIDLSGSQY